MEKVAQRHMEHRERDELTMGNRKQYRITFYDSIDLRIDTLEFAWLLSKHYLDVVAKADAVPVLLVQADSQDQVTDFMNDVNYVAGQLLFERVEVLRDGEYVAFF